MIFDALDQGCPKIEQYGLAPPDISGKANAKVILFFFFFFNYTNILSMVGRVAQVQELSHFREVGILVPFCILTKQHNRCMLLVRGPPLT